MDVPFRSTCRRRPAGVGSCVEAPGGYGEPCGSEKPELWFGKKLLIKKGQHRQRQCDYRGMLKIAMVRDHRLLCPWVKARLHNHS